MPAIGVRILAGSRREGKSVGLIPEPKPPKVAGLDDLHVTKLLGSRWTLESITRCGAYTERDGERLRVLLGIARDGDGRAPIGQLSGSCHDSYHL
jgi:hypothetical protein